jgi:hypothetical protein
MPRKKISLVSLLDDEDAMDDVRLAQREQIEAWDEDGNLDEELDVFRKKKKRTKRTLKMVGSTGFLKPIEALVQKYKTRTKSPRVWLVEPDLEVSYSMDTVDGVRRRTLYFTPHLSSESIGPYIRIIEHDMMKLLRQKKVDAVIVENIDDETGAKLEGNLRDVTRKVANLTPDMGSIMGRRRRWLFDPDEHYAYFDRRMWREQRDRVVEPVQDAGRRTRRRRYK